MNPDGSLTMHKGCESCARFEPFYGKAWAVKTDTLKLPHVGYKQAKLLRPHEVRLAKEAGRKVVGVTALDALVNDIAEAGAALEGGVLAGETDVEVALGELERAMFSRGGRGKGKTSSTLVPRKKEGGGQKSPSASRVMSGVDQSALMGADQPDFDNLLNSLDDLQGKLRKYGSVS